MPFSSTLTTRPVATRLANPELRTLHAVATTGAGVRRLGATPAGVTAHRAEQFVHGAAGVGTGDWVLALGSPVTIELMTALAAARQAGALTVLFGNVRHAAGADAAFFLTAGADDPRLDAAVAGLAAARAADAVGPLGSVLRGAGAGRVAVGRGVGAARAETALALALADAVAQGVDLDRLGRVAVFVGGTPLTCAFECGRLSAGLRRMLPAAAQCWAATVPDCRAPNDALSITLLLFGTDRHGC